MASRLREAIDLQFSPELSMVVSRIRETRDSRSKRKLVALLPPDKANAKRISKIVKQLKW